MASLTEIAISSRRIIRYGIYLLILIVILRYAIAFGIDLYKKAVPPKQPKATVAFGGLPKLILPPKDQPQNLTYKLELPVGDLPKLPEQLAVYAMTPSSSSSLTVIDDAKVKARSMGFDPNGKQLADLIPNVYVFTKADGLSNLKFNIVNNNFAISYDLEKNPGIVSGQVQPPSQAENFVKGFLGRASLLTDDLSQGQTISNLLKLDGGNFVKADSESEATLIRVNLFRQNLGTKGEYISVTPKMPQANIWFLIAGGSSEIIAGEYHYFPIDTTKVSTYPLITSQEAWEKLQKGESYIMNITDNQGSQVIIRKVYLAYYDPGQFTKYYQPVVVFQGDNDFYSLVPAVNSQYYDKEPAENK